MALFLIRLMRIFPISLDNILYDVPEYEHDHYASDQYLSHSYDRIDVFFHNVII
jgi:hypothetical protein